jgi:cytochrome c peroxidase
MRRNRALLLAMGLCLVGDPGHADEALRARARALFGPLEPPAASNVAEVALGRRLFFDTAISADGRTGCVSCHLPGQWGADGRARSPDARGRLTSRNSQTIFNAVGQPALRWVGDRDTAARQAEGSLTGSLGFASTADALPLLRQRGYEPGFRAAFPGMAEPLSTATYGRALEAFQATLVTPGRFDDWLRGDDAALGPLEQQGLQTFIDTGCAGCHRGPRLGGEAFAKFGVVKDYWTETGSTDRDTGREAVTRNPADRHVFRVQMLRNVARTAPYFHDGSVADLREAVRVMAAVQLGRTLTAAETGAITAFLESLTGSVPAGFSTPADPG